MKVKTKSEGRTGAIAPSLKTQAVLIVLLTFQAFAFKCNVHHYNVADVQPARADRQHPGAQARAPGQGERGGELAHRGAEVRVAHPLAGLRPRGGEHRVRGGAVLSLSLSLCVHVACS
jgi:hypothetical protein